MRAVRDTFRHDRVVQAAQPYNNGGDASKRVYVGNLSWEVSWQELKDHMRSAGGRVVRADVMTEPSGRSKGYGIVEFSSGREARIAIERLNDTELKGRQVFVREDRELGGQVSAQQQVQHVKLEPASIRTVLVSNLPAGYAWQDLKDVMKQAGSVIRADVLFQDGTTVGIVEFASVADARVAIATLNNVNISQHIVTLQFHNNAPAEIRHVRDTASVRKVYVGQLAWGVAWQDLKDHFKQIGVVTRADVALEADGRRSKGYGFVEFESSDDASRAIVELNDSDLMGRRIHVREYKED